MASFRIARSVDCDAIVKLMDRYYAEDGYAFSEERARALLAEFLQTRHLGRLWVLDADGQVAGYMAVTLGFSFEHGGRDAFLDELYIDELHRGQGLGRSAIELATRYCAGKGVNALHLEVENHRETARRLYESIGFASSDRHLMSKRITGDEG